MNLSVPLLYIYNATMGQDKIAEQKITRKHGKIIDKKDLHGRRIGVRFEKGN